MLWLLYCKYTFTFSCSLHCQTSCQFAFLGCIMILRGFSLHLSCRLLINCDHILIFIFLSSFMISIKIFYLKQLIDFGAFSFLRKILFLLSISFHFFQLSIFQISILHSHSPQFFSPNSLWDTQLEDLGHEAYFYLLH